MDKVERDRGVEQREVGSASWVKSSDSGSDLVDGKTRDNRNNRDWQLHKRRGPDIRPLQRAQDGRTRTLGRWSVESLVKSRLTGNRSLVDRGNEKDAWTEIVWRCTSAKESVQVDDKGWGNV